MFPAPERLYRQAKAWGINLSVDQATAYLRKVDVRRIMTPLYAAFGHSVLLLLDDSVSYSANHWARGHEWFAVGSIFSMSGTN